MDATWRCTGRANHSMSSNLPMTIGRFVRCAWVLATPRARFGKDLCKDTPDDPPFERPSLTRG
jgi:hypothetical protein